MISGTCQQALPVAESLQRFLSSKTSLPLCKRSQKTSLLRGLTVRSSSRTGGIMVNILAADVHYDASSRSSPFHFGVSAVPELVSWL